MKKIVVISDCSDVAYNEIRATMLKEIEDNQEQIVIEPLVIAKEFSVINGAFLVRLMAEVYNPLNTIFLIILNSLKTIRKDRARLIGETKNGFKFVSENTGVLNWLIQDFGLKSLYEFNNRGLNGKYFISFGGKYFYAPMAVKVAKGIPLKELGKAYQGSLSNFKIQEGTVVHIDNFGVAKLKNKLLNFKDGQNIDICINKSKKISAVFTYSMKNLPDGTLAVYNGSSLNNLPEIGKVRELGSANKLGIKIGDIVEFKKQ